MLFHVICPYAREDLAVAIKLQRSQTTGRLVEALVFDPVSAAVRLKSFQDAEH